MNNHIKVRDPILSVCLISYNQSKFIKQAIDSILMQKVDFIWEIIIADDYSTDGTREIIIEYSKRYVNLIKTIFQKENVGAQLNFYALKANASGKYIAYLEADDYWTDVYKLQKQVNFLEQNQDYGLVWSDVDFLYEKTGKIKKAVFKNNQLPIFNSFEDVLINKPFFSPLTWVYRRDLLPNKIYNYCDATFPMILDILYKSKIKHFPEVMATYRVLEESASHSKSLVKKYKFITGVFNIQEDYLKFYNIKDNIRNKLYLNHYLSAHPYAIALGDKDAINKGELILEKSQNKNFKIKLILIISKLKIGRAIIRTIYSNDYIKNIIRKFIK